MINKTEKYTLNRIMEKTDNTVTVEISIPKESPYFDGHFPQISVLPAVAQVELISFFAKEYFNGNIAIVEIKKAKFANLIMPSVPLILQINKNKDRLTFNINSPNNGIVYSSGTIIIKEVK